ncbi:MAG TPA: outer membrane beta-barrel protein [Bacteroidales bacterium]|nr:outer membrane beta-barrel protein [Bacteroidales bacterium]HPS18462.1 outer membrane beta-barrel protein [Bacteroidales bacterium]
MLDPDTKNSDYLFIQNGANGTINYVYNKINVYGKFGSNLNNFNLQATDRQEYSSGLTIDKNPIDKNDMNATMHQFSSDYTVGADYYLNPKHTISFESNYSVSPLSKNITEENYNVDYLMNENVFNNFLSQGINKTSSNSNYNTLFYTAKYNDKNSLNSNFTFSNYHEEYINNYKENSIIKRIENGTNDKNSTALNIDYTHTFSNSSSIELGYGNTWQNQNNEYTVESTVSDFNYTDTRHKFFSYYAWQGSKKLSAKAGLAVETSTPNADGQKNSYIIFQPYTDLKYKASKVVDFKLKYRSESNYPSISQTNPFTYVIDQNSIRTGNPSLRPDVTHKISLQSNILGGLLTIEPYFHFSNNYITETGSLKNDSIFEYSYHNSGKYKNYGVEANLTVPFGKSLFLQSSVNLYNSSIEYAGYTNNVNDMSMSHQLVYVNEKSGSVAGFQYQNGLCKYITAQGYNMWNNDFWILFVQQPFFKKRLSVMLVYFTPITWGVDFKQGNYIHSGAYSETKLYDISILKNIVMFELTYRFNKGKTVNKTEKNIERKSEKTSKGLF